MNEAESGPILQEVKTILSKITEYSEGAQSELFLSCYDHLPTFIHISSDGTMRNFEEFKKICSGYYNSLKEQKINTIRESFQVIDQNLVVTGWTGNIVAELKNGDFLKMNNYSITSVFKKIANHWKIIHSHESALPPELIKKG